jgi:hypothetical protein
MILSFSLWAMFNVVLATAAGWVDEGAIADARSGRTGP